MQKVDMDFLGVWIVTTEPPIHAFTQEYIFGNPKS
jgi:hypothetical protein